MFPGQGTQYDGMGKEFYEQYDVCKATFDLASSVTGLDIAGLCFGKSEMLSITAHTQIALHAAHAYIQSGIPQNTDYWQKSGYLLWQ